MHYLSTCGYPAGRTKCPRSLRTSELNKSLVQLARS